MRAPGLDPGIDPRIHLKKSPDVMDGRIKSGNDEGVF